MGFAAKEIELWFRTKTQLDLVSGRVGSSWWWTERAHADP
jgi:hypothetical protein